MRIHLPASLCLCWVVTQPWVQGQQIIQPGAPGQASKIVAPGNTGSALRAPSAADVSFMQGMIMHHAQAIEMVDLLRKRARNKNLRLLGERMRISQGDEIEYMKQWLRDRGQADSGGGHMDHTAAMKKMGGDTKAMDMKGMDMGSMEMMPGMLTPQQMQALAKASSTPFDRLFLRGMIQHHTGALTMVQELFATAGAGQDAVIFDFATDVDNTQSAEIEVMQRMLKEIK